MAGLADLYQPEQAPTLKPTTQRITAQDVEAPHEMLAKAHDASVATFEKVAEETASPAGQETDRNRIVTRDENGNIQSIDLAKFPILGPASAVYRREANQALYTNMMPEIQQQLQKIR